MSKDSNVQVVASDSALLRGNWHPFPPPEPGVYDLRRTHTVDPLAFEFLPNRRIYRTLAKSGRLMCMGQRVSKMRPQDGWQFRFRPSRSRFVPFAVLYDTSVTPPVAAERRRISDQLPVAVSIEEARYIVRSMPERWPAYTRIHVEYTEEKLQS